MAQDSGVIIAWHKAPGDVVSAADVLFEVETDKATMDVEAGHDGYVAALYAEAGEEAPVGAVIAVISAAKPESPVQRSMKATPAAKAPAPAAEKKPAPAIKPAAAPAGTKPAPTKVQAPKRAINGPILASPKARHLAAEQGLDLSRLAAEGIPMPYHVADLETLRNLPDTTAPAASSVALPHVTARVPQAGFATFTDWLGERATPQAVLAGFAAASLRAATGAGAQRRQRRQRFRPHPRLRGGPAQCQRRDHPSRWICRTAGRAAPSSSLTAKDRPCRPTFTSTATGAPARRANVST